MLWGKKSKSGRRNRSVFCYKMNLRVGLVRKKDTEVINGSKHYFLLIFMGLYERSCNLPVFFKLFKLGTILGFFLFLFSFFSFLTFFKKSSKILKNIYLDTQTSFNYFNPVIPPVHYCLNPYTELGTLYQ